MKRKMNEELKADRRRENATVYLLLAGKVVMMRTQPNIHGQHTETQSNKHNGIKMEKSTETQT